MIHANVCKYDTVINQNKCMEVLYQQGFNARNKTF